MARTDDRPLLSRVERQLKSFVPHFAEEGHPAFCTQAAIQIKVWDCLMGSPEANVELDWTASLDRHKVVRALEMALQKMRFDIQYDEYLRLREAERAANPRPYPEGIAPGGSLQPGEGRRPA